MTARRLRTQALRAASSAVMRLALAELHHSR